MFLVPNIDQMYKEMKKIVEVGNKHGNGDEFPDFADLFFFGITIVRVGGKILGSVGRSETHMFFFLALPYLFNSWLCHCWLVIQIEFTQENNSHTNFVHSARGGNSKYHVQLVLSHWYFEFHLNVFAH